MNGAEALIRTLLASGVDLCLTNPGTSEMHLVAAIDKVEGMRSVLGLFEGVVTGAADGYGRMAGKPACTLLHLGPGLGNGLANLHNARRAFTPIVNVVGDHATYHRGLDAPLTSNIEGIAGPMSAWVNAAISPDDLAALGAEAVAAAMAPPGGNATLIVPADMAWGEGASPADPIAPPARQVPDADAIEGAARTLKQARKPAILLGGQAVLEPGLEAAGRIVAATGAMLFCDTFNARVPRGAGRVTPSPLPYFGEDAIAALSDVDLLLIIGTKAPVAFFAYPGKPSSLVPEGCEPLILAGPEMDALATLVALAEAVDAPAQPLARQERVVQPRPQAGPLTAGNAGEAIGALLPENAIIVDEGVTSRLGAYFSTIGGPPHDWLDLTGGSIGYGLPAAAGAALACPDRKVVCLEGDGSAMYTIQALWTMAREKLDVTTVIFSNRSYVILNIELMRVGAENPGPKALSMLDIGRPDMNFAKMAEGMGVEAMRAETAEDFTKYFEYCMRTKGPHLIDAVI